MTDFDPMTRAGFNNIGSRMHQKDGTGATDALFELAVKHGTSAHEAAGYAHTINNALIALYEASLKQEQGQGIPEDYMAFTYMAVETIRSRMAELGFLVPRRVISEGVSAALSVQQKGSGDGHAVIYPFIDDYS